MKTKILLGVIVAVILTGLAVFLYQTRPVAAPTTDVNSQVTHLDDQAQNTSDVSALSRTLRIDSTASHVDFSLGEDLNGKTITVNGITDQLAGDVQLNTDGTFSMTIGEIKIDARTFKTDNERRNAAIARMILKTEEAGNEYIVFTPNKIEGLPEKVVTNEAFSYQVTGNLTIAGSTRMVTFATTSTLKEDGSLQGFADTTIAYGDWGITVPDLPFLANVEKTTKLQIVFVAR